MKRINVVLFDDFTILDAFGPVDVFNRLHTHYTIDFFSLNGERVRAAQNLLIETKSFECITHNDLLLVPGGFGTRRLVDDTAFISALRELAVKSEYVLSVCTGSALLAKAGLLDGLRATSNKMSLEWVISQGPGVNWVRRARWVSDGKYYTSSGVSAGIDMALAFVNDTFGEDTAVKIAASLEYIRHSDPSEDPFAKS